MFSSFKLPSLRPRSRSFSNAGAAGSGSECSLLHKPPKTPVGSPKQKHHRKSNVSVSRYLDWLSLSDFISVLSELSGRKVHLMVKSKRMRVTVFIVFLNFNRSAIFNKFTIVIWKWTQLNKFFCPTWSKFAPLKKALEIEKWLLTLFITLHVKLCLKV